MLRRFMSILWCMANTPISLLAYKCPNAKWTLMHRWYYSDSNTTKCTSCGEEWSPAWQCDHFESYTTWTQIREGKKSKPCLA